MQFKTQKLKDKKPLLALAVLLGLGGIGATLAYYTDTTIITDRLRTDSFAVQTTHETFYYGSLTPGQTIQQTYRTTNLGSTLVAVRYYYIAQWTDQDGNPLPLGAELPDADGTIEPVAIMQVEPRDTMQRIGNQNVLPWKYDQAATTYCADPVVVSDPEHYSCETETDDITQAYSVLAGPFYHYKALAKDETTVNNPFKPFVYTERLASTKTVTTTACVRSNSQDNLCDDESGFYTENGAGNFLRGVSNGILTRTVDYANPYSSGTYNFSLISESIEYAHVRDIWGEYIEIEGPVI